METKKQNNQIVNVTSTALEELKRLIQKETDNPDGVRLSLLAGGCSGLSYHLQFDKLKEKDYIDNLDGLKIIIDPKSALYINGITLDYQGGLNGRGFVFSNPNATKSCGCGTSFSVGDKEVTLEFVSSKKPMNVCPSSNNK
ncbi:MAG: iron-sulfur cluster assembly accessory protein [Candidatus Melainabacteria bacterium]|nr:iron-sulfur cluster assembly accessory protein [Candidatus Melainabacteria bacterium]